MQRTRPHLLARGRSVLPRTQGSNIVKRRCFLLTNRAIPKKDESRTLLSACRRIGANQRVVGCARQTENSSTGRRPCRGAAAPATRIPDAPRGRFWRLSFRRRDGPCARRDSCVPPFCCLYLCPAPLRRG